MGKKRVAAYVRVSTASDAQIHSYEFQEQYWQSKFEDDPQYDLVGIYADRGISGNSIKKRDQFQAMMQDARDGKLDVIYTKSVSRFARNTVDLLDAVRELRDLGTEVVFEKEYIETALYLISTPNTGLFFAYCSIYCGFVGLLELAHYGLSLVCRLNIL